MPYLDTEGPECPFKIVSQGFALGEEDKSFLWLLSPGKTGGRGGEVNPLPRGGGGEVREQFSRMITSS